MKKQILFAACTLFAASALLMTSCQQAEEPIANDPTDQAGPMTRAATLGNFYRVVYVEVNDVNPLNAGEYLLSDGTPFFTHVILFASNIRGDASGNVHNYNNPNNAAILANPSTYIAPLQAKGIKVIMGNLGDHTGAGFANLTAAQIGTYTDDLVAYDNIVDGYDFDDEWAEYGTRGYPYANSTSYSNMIIALAGKTNKSISVFDWGNTGTLSSTAISHLDWGCQGSLNGYGFNSSFAAGKPAAVRKPDQSAFGHRNQISHNAGQERRDATGFHRFVWIVGNAPRIGIKRGRGVSPTPQVIGNPKLVAVLRPCRPARKMQAGHNKD